MKHTLFRIIVMMIAGLLFGPAHAQSAPSGCYDSSCSTFTVTTGTDPCTFTACASICTSDTVVGYEWVVSTGGGATHRLTTHSDCFTFSITPGSTATVSVTVHMIDFNFATGTNPCCEAAFSQEVSCSSPPECTDTTASHLDATSVATSTGCLFTCVATITPLTGWTVAGYQWSTGSGFFAGSDTLIAGSILPGGPLTVTVVATLTNEASDTCTDTISRTFTCSDTVIASFCHSPGTEILASETGSTMGGCLYVCTANVVPATGWTISGYEWSEGGAFVSGTSVYSVSPVSPGGSTIVTVVAILTDVYGGICHDTLHRTLICDAIITTNCTDTTSSLTGYTTTDTSGNCIFHCTASVVPLTGWTILGYRWSEGGSYASGSGSYVTATIPYGSPVTVSVIATLVDSVGDLCYDTLNHTFSCLAITDVCVDSAGSSLTGYSASAPTDSCVFNCTATITPTAGWTISGYQWSENGGTFLSGSSTFTTTPVARGRSVTVAVVASLIDSMGNRCTDTLRETFGCLIASYGCADTTNDTITGVSTHDPSGGCKYTCTASVTPLPGWTITGYQWSEGGAFVPGTATYTTTPVALNATMTVTAVALLTDTLGNICSDTVRQTFGCSCTSVTDMSGFCPCTLSTGCAYDLLEVIVPTSGWTVSLVEWSDTAGIFVPDTATYFHTRHIWVHDSMTVEYAVLLTDTFGNTCADTVIRAFGCTGFVVDSGCTDTAATYMSYTLDTTSTGGCVFVCTLTATPTAGWSILSYKWSEGGAPFVTGTTTYTTTPTYPGGTVTLTAVVLLRNALGDYCTDTIRRTFGCVGTSCIGIVAGTMTGASVPDLSGGCYFACSSGVTPNPGWTITGYQWSDGGAFSSGTSGHNTPSVTVGDSVTVTLVVSLSGVYGETCSDTFRQTFTCVEHHYSINCVDSSSYISGSSFVIFGRCFYSNSAHITPLSGWTITDYQWSDGGAFTSGGTSFTPSFLIIGSVQTITLVVTLVNGTGDTCRDTVDHINSCVFPGPASPGRMSPGGISDLVNPAAWTEANGISIYPNPAEDVVTVTASRADLFSIEVIDVFGKKLINLSYSDTKSTNISLKNLPPGSYLFKVNNIFTKVVVKAK